MRWSANVHLPDLPLTEENSPADVHLYLDSWPDHVDENEGVAVYAPEGPDSTRWVHSLKGGEYFLVRYDADGTRFLIHRSGSQIWCRRRSAYSLKYIGTYLFGPILGFVLRLRGTVCLHGSVVGMEGRAIGVLGPKEAGKSTFAAGWAQQGLPVLSDDILALVEADGLFQAESAYPRLRLWPESVSALFGSPDALPPISEGWDKKHLDLTEEYYQFEVSRQPLAAIYVLGARTGECLGSRIEEIRGAAAVKALIANTYAFRMFDTEMRKYEFGFLSRLAAQVPIRSLTPWTDLGRLGELCRTVMADVERDLVPAAQI